MASFAARRLWFSLFLFILLPVLSLPGPAHGQPLPPGFNRLMPPGGTVQSPEGAIQDEEGFIWIIDLNRLVRYDGYSFTKIIRTTNGVDLNIRGVNKGLAGGNHGQLSFFSPDAFLIYSIHSNEAYVLTVHEFLGLSRGDVRITCAAQSPTGRFTYGTREGVLLQADAGPDGLTVAGTVNLSDSLGEQISITGLVAGDDGTIWVGTHQGLIRLGDSGTVAARYGTISNGSARLPSDSIAVLAPGRSGTLLVALRGGTVGLLDTTSLKYIACGPPPDRMASDEIMALCQDSAGYIWVATLYSGLFRWDPRLSRWETFLLRGGRKQTAPMIKTVFVDRSGVLWAATIGEGMLTYSPIRHRFRSCTPETGPPFGLSSLNVSAAWKDRKGTLWVGTGSDGVNVLPAGATKFRLLSHNPRDPRSLSSNYVICIMERRNGEIWVTTAKGINIYQRSGGSFLHLRHRDGDETSLRCDTVTTAYEDRAGDIWVAHFAGVDRYDAGTQSFSRVLEWPPETVGRTGTVSRFLEDSRGYLWMVSDGRGVCRLDPARRDTFWFRMDPRLYPENPTGATAGLCEDEYGTVWITSARGLISYRHDTNESKLFRFLEPTATLFSLDAEALESSVDIRIAGAVPVGKTLWLATSSGVARFDIPTEQFHLYGLSDGAVVTKGRFSANFRAYDGTVYIGGVGGLTWFHPDSILPAGSPPVVAVTQVRMFGKPISHTVGGTRKLDLSPWEDTFSVDFAVMDFVNPERNCFQYMLEGSEGEWTDLGLRHTVTFANVRPGDYTLRLRGANSDGVWSVQDYALAVTIAPPFWETSWFRAAGVLVLLMAGYGAYRYRLSKAVTLERLRLRIAGDLHDEIGSNLGSIALQGEAVARLAPFLPPDAHDRLREIVSLARDTSQSMRDIVWLINPRHDTVGDLTSKLRETVLKMLDGTEVRFHASGPMSGILMDMEKKRNILLLYKEILHNIRKHSWANTVVIEVHSADRILHLKVADDGIGFDESRLSNGEGLATMKRRAGETGGTLAVRSSPAKGTTVELHVPL